MKLRVYGPGGPFTPMKECAAIFARQTGIETIVSSGAPESLIDEIRLRGDLVYMGAEYMMSDFIAQCPGLINAAEVVKLYLREVGIIMRKGNPRGVGSLYDLGKPGFKILDVSLENMKAIQAGAPGIRENICARVETGQEGLNLWLADSTIDFWITYRSWHIQMTGSSDFIGLPEKVFRATPAAIIAASPNREAAGEFLNFLKSENAHSIFRKWGWE